MADRRKLQGEVDRCLKKVSEGCELFEDIWKKVQNATNVNQKEKYESELKKEIKKLQRLREQIKTWLTSSDIKDKKSLLDNRKLIELQMERFRIVEKETKTKAYSKEGLGQANKVDPETKEKERCREWLNESINTLGIQIDQMECEIESINAGTKKKKLDKDKVERIENLNERIEKHRFHTTQLEHILRLLDNETIEVESVNKIREDIEYYVENNQDQDIDEMELEGIYEDLDLDTLIGAEIIKNPDDNDDDSIQSSPSSSLTSSHFHHSMNSPAKSNTASPRKNSKSSSSSVPTTPSLSNGISSSGTSSSTTKDVPSTTSSSHTPSKRNLFSSTSSSTTTSSSSNTTTSSIVTTSSTTSSSSTTPSLSSSSSTDSDSTVSVATTSVPLVNGFDHPSNSETSSTTTTSISTTLPTEDDSPSIQSSTNQTAVSSSSSSSSDNTDVTVSSVTGTTSSLPTEEETAVQAVRNHVESLKHPGYNSNSSIWRGSSASTTAPDTTALPSSQPAPPSTATDTNVVTATETATATAETSSILAGTQPGTTLPTTSQPNPLPYPSTKMDDPLSQNNTDFAVGLKTSSLFGSVMNHTGSIGQKLSTSDTQEVRLQPVHGVAPLGPVLLSQERVKQLKMLDTAYHHLPQRQDSERMRPYISRSAVPIAPYHHHPAPPNIDSLEFFQRLSTETLFFIFYYQEGTRAQYLAAKALKKQSWRFHTKYMMWFQRHEEPKRITDEYEEGTYIFFDYEKWSQRKRDGFTFEYRYLEDKDLP